MPGMPPAGLFAAHPMHSRFGGYVQGLASKLITLAANIDAGQCLRGERAHGGHEGGGIVIERLARFCFTSKHRNASGSISSRTETWMFNDCRANNSSTVGRSDFMSMSGLPASSLSIPCQNNRATGRCTRRLLGVLVRARTVWRKYTNTVVQSKSSVSLEE